MKRKIFGSIILAAITLGISAPAVNAATETNDTQAVAISELNSSSCFGNFGFGSRIRKFG